MKFYPLKVKHGWVVAASVIDTDSEATVMTKKGANQLAANLNKK
jgi:hypothetical protein